jgi:hypothetical protein
VKSTLIAALALVSALPLTAQDRHIVRLAGLPLAGIATTTSETIVSTATINVLDPKGAVLQSQQMAEVEESRYRESRSDASHVVRTYDVATKDSGQGLKHLSHEKQSIRFAFASNGTVSATSQGAVDPKKLKDLSETMKRSLDMEKVNYCIPKTPLAVGESWTVAQADVDACFNPFSSGGRGTATGTLTEVVEKNGSPTAMVDFKVSVLVRDVGELQFSAPATFEQTLRFEVPTGKPTTIGSYHFTGRLDGSARPGGPTKPSVRMIIDLKGDGETVGTPGNV